MSVAELDASARDGGVRLAVFVKPRASRSKIVGLHAGALGVALAAAPVDGAANAELVKLLAETLRVPRSAIAIAVGASSRRKLVDVAGLALDELRERLAATL